MIPVKRLVVGLLLCFVGACGSASSDAEALCAIAGEVMSDATIGPESRSRTIAERFMQRSLTSATSVTFEMVAGASPDTRYELMQAGFRDMGIEGWECPALRDAWSAAE